MSNRKEREAALGFYNIIRDIVREELAQRDCTVLCRIAKVNNDGTYDVFVEPDEATRISSIPAVVHDADLKVGDFVYVYKVANQLNNSFILKTPNVIGLSKSS